MSWGSAMFFPQHNLGSSWGRGRGGQPPFTISQVLASKEEAAQDWRPQIPRVITAGWALSKASFHSESEAGLDPPLSLGVRRELLQPVSSGALSSLTLSPSVKWPGNNMTVAVSAPAAHAPPLPLISGGGSWALISSPFPEAAPSCLSS